MIGIGRAVTVAVGRQHRQVQGLIQPRQGGILHRGAVGDDQRLGVTAGKGEHVEAVRAPADHEQQAAAAAHGDRTRAFQRHAGGVVDARVIGQGPGLGIALERRPRASSSTLAPTGKLARTACGSALSPRGMIASEPARQSLHAAHAIGIGRQEVQRTRPGGRTGRGKSIRARRARRCNRKPPPTLVQPNESSHVGEGRIAQSGHVARPGVANRQVVGHLGAGDDRGFGYWSW